MGKILARIKEIADNEGITIGALERSIGASKGVLSRAISNQTDIQAKWLECIVENYPQYSTRWLLCGEGEMIDKGHKLVKTNPAKGENYVPPTTPIGEHIVHITENPKEGIPLIPFSAMAGALTGEQTVFEYECERYVVPAFKGADFLMPVKGSSMQPTYVSGDIVACQRVPMGGIFFQWNKPYVLDTAQGALIKRIKPGSDKQHVLLISDNENYDPFELSISDIHAVALVVGMIRLE